MAVGDPVLSANPVEQDLCGGGPNRAVNTSAKMLRRYGIPDEALTDKTSLIGPVRGRWLSP
jgi:hypothetical protein